MKRIISIALTLVCLLGMFTFTVSAEGTTLYVSTKGSDLNGDGSIDAPFATIKGAKDAAKTIAKTAPVTVIIQEGTYYASEGLKFVSTDNGAENAEVTYKADGNVIITGKKTLNASDFSPVTDPAMLLRMRREVRGKVYGIDLKKYGLGGLERVKLFINDEKMNEARYPNTEYLTITNSEEDNTITVSDSRVYEWENAKDAYATGSFGATYFWGETKIENIAAGELTLARKTTSSIKMFVNNLIEEIDLVGEYAVDSETGMLLCYLPENYKNMEFEVINPTLDSAYIDINSAEYINFEGITFDKLSASAFSLSNADNIGISNCDFNYIQSSYAVNISASTNVTVSDNTAYGCSGGFLTMGNCGNSSTLEPGNIVVSGNYITNCGEVLTNINYIIGGGTNNTGTSRPVGNRIVNNVIGNCSAVYAITLPGNSNEIMYNEIYNVGRHIDDGGAVYFGKSVTRHGNEVAYNYIHDLNTENMYAGVYVDDGYSGIDVHHNVFYNMYHPVHLGLGMDVKVTDNIAVETSKGILSGTRMTSYPNTNNAFYEEMSNLFSNEAKKEVYLAAYPELTGALDRHPFFAPYNSQINGNVLYGSANPFWQSATHKYYADDGVTVRISGEENNTRITEAMKTANSVNELAAYGAIVTDASGNSLNGTNLGNPNEKTYSETYFKNFGNQDFTLTSEATVLESYVNSGSKAAEIDMSKIGVTDTALFENEAEFNVYPSYTDGELFVKWDRVKGATGYKVKMGSYTSLIQYDDNLETTFESVAFTRGADYEITVTAIGLARQNQFEAVSETVSFTVPGDLQTETLDYALSRLKEEIDSERTYTDTTVSGELSALYSEVSAASYTTEAEIIAAEDEIFTLLAYASEVLDTSFTGITKCEAVNSGTEVQVIAEGFTPYSLATILVTNPDYTLENLTEENEEIVRYTNIMSADSNGIVRFTFDTKINDIDYAGEYRVYVSGSDGTVLDSTYVYGTVEAGEATFIVDSAEVNAEDLYRHAGKAVTVKVPVTSRIGADITPSLVCAVYNASGSLLSVEMANETVFNKNSVTTAEMTFTIPENYSVLSSMQLMIFDEDVFLKPLSLNRVITKK